jgi:translation initiation factor IF-3
MDVRVLGPEKETIGIMRIRKALNEAEAQGLDLVLVTEAANPPVVQIADYGKMRYDQKKNAKLNKTHVQEQKTVQISPVISDHDLETFTNRSREFLSKGDKVEIVCRFRARQIAHPELGRAKISRMVEALQDVSTMISQPVLDGKHMKAILIPKKAP